MNEHLTDESREDAIARAARLMEFFLASGDRLRADTARTLMYALIAGRRPEYANFLERQRGLDLPACANEATQ